MINSSSLSFLAVSVFELKQREQSKAFILIKKGNVPPSESTKMLAVGRWLSLLVSVRGSIVQPHTISFPVCYWSAWPFRTVGTVRDGIAETGSALWEQHIVYMYSSCSARIKLIVARELRSCNMCSVWKSEGLLNLNMGLLIKQGRGK